MIWLEKHKTSEFVTHFDTWIVDFFLSIFNIYPTTKL